MKPTTISAGAVANEGIARKIGDRNSETRKSSAVTMPVRPVRPPSATPEADSTKVVVVEVPSTAPAEVASASDSSAPLILGSLPSLSSMSALEATPISVPSVSNMSTNRNASIMVIKFALKMPEKSSLPRVGMTDGIASPFAKFGRSEYMPKSGFGT